MSYLRISVVSVLWMLVGCQSSVDHAAVRDKQDELGFGDVAARCEDGPEDTFAQMPGTNELPITLKLKRGTSGGEWTISLETTTSNALDRTTWETGNVSVADYTVHSCRMQRNTLSTKSLSKSDDLLPPNVEGEPGTEGLLDTPTPPADTEAPDDLVPPDDGGSSPDLLLPPTPSAEPPSRTGPPGAGLDYPIGQQGRGEFSHCFQYEYFASSASAWSVPGGAADECPVEKIVLAFSQSTPDVFRLDTQKCGRSHYLRCRTVMPGLLRDFSATHSRSGVGCPLQSQLSISCDDYFSNGP